MSEFESDCGEYSDDLWLQPDDPWYKRPYIGECKNTMPPLLLEPRVATFYGSDADDEPEAFNLSDVEREETPLEQPNVIKSGKRYQLFADPKADAYFEPSRMTDSAYKEMLKKAKEDDERSE